MVWTPVIVAELPSYAARVIVTDTDAPYANFGACEARLKALLHGAQSIPVTLKITKATCEQR